MPSFCAQCGAALAADAKFCEECGAQVGGKVPSGVTRPKRMPLLVALSLAAVLGIGALSLFFSIGRPVLESQGGPVTLWLSAWRGGKQSAVEGKLVDWNGKPVASVKITASQVQPLKGYEQFEGVTKADGTFRLSGLFPSSAYVLKPWSDKWTCETAVRIESAPQGETSVLPAPMKIARAFSKSNGSLVIDLSTGATRFTVSSDGVISDSRTGLEWVVGPDHDMNYAQAEQWVAGCKVASGSWRMPTMQELRTLYQWGIMDPVFKLTSWRVWAEPRDSSSAWYFRNGDEYWSDRRISSSGRVFGVRSRPR